MSVKKLKEFTLKVERINCCSECPKQAEKKLKKLEGVDSVSIDVNKGLVTVSGIIEPADIINKFQVWGRKAVLHHDDDDEQDDGHNDHGDSNPCSVAKKKVTCVELADRPSCRDDCDVNDWLKSTLPPTSHENALQQQQQPPVQIGKPSGKKTIGFGGTVCKVFKLIKPKGKSESVIGAKPKFAEGAGKWHFPKTPGYEFGPSRPFLGTQFPGTSMYGVPYFTPFTPLYTSNGGAMGPGGLMTPPPPPPLPPYSCYGPMRPPMLPPYGGASGLFPSSQRPGEIQRRPMVHYTRYEDDYLPHWT